MPFLGIGRPFRRQEGTGASQQNKGPLLDGSLFTPDLISVDDNGKALLIEVEVEANNNREQRQARWRNALHANGR